MLPDMRNRDRQRRTPRYAIGNALAPHTVRHTGTQRLGPRCQCPVQVLMSRCRQLHNQLLERLMAVDEKGGVGALELSRVEMTDLQRW